MVPVNGNNSQGVLVVFMEPAVHVKHIETYAGGSGGGVDVMTHGHIVMMTDVEMMNGQGQYARVVVVQGEYQATSTPPMKMMKWVGKRVVPGGHVRIVQKMNADVEKLWRKTMILCGYKNVVVEDEGITCEKLPWDANATVPLHQEKNGGNAWKIRDDEEEEMIDEEDLLQEDDMVRPVPGKQGEDSGCAPTKKACANCTCGKAEGKVTKLTKEMIENPTTGCGSCALGDAFRCAGCPYRGLPAFEPGKKIELPPDFLVDDL